MKIKSKNFCVPEGEKVTLKKWPTLVKPVYQSKEQYQKMLKEQVPPRAVQGKRCRRPRRSEQAADLPQ